MSSSREESPDWLRSFQAPTSSMVSLSSLSKSSPDDSPLREEEISSSPKKPSQILVRDESHVIDRDEDAGKSPSRNSKAKPVTKRMKKDHAFSTKKKAANTIELEGEGDTKKVSGKEFSKKHIDVQALDHSVLTLSSDSEPSIFKSSIIERKISQSEVSEKEDDVVLIVTDGQSSVKKDTKKKSLKNELKGGQARKKEKHVNGSVKSEERDVDMEVVEEETSDKQIKPCVSTSRLPLVLSEKVSRTKALVECDGESIDLSGDMGAVGRIVVSDTSSSNQEMYLDLKGTIYKTTIVPSRTFCIVSVGQSEAKIDAIMNDFIQLKPPSNVYEAETMVEGTLEGFSFESEDEMDKNPKASSQQMDQSGGADEQTNRKAKGKAEKASGSVKKRGRATKEKPQPAKKARKKSAASKKTKAKK